jgi:hypothetical protein
MDDLVWGAIIRAPDLGTMLSIPAHAPPGFFLVLRVALEIFRDPEWSLQLVPFMSGVLAIPLIAVAAWRLTGSPGLAMLGAALAALNPLAAHYSVFVKQYVPDLLVTAGLLAGGGTLLTRDFDRGRFWRVSLLAGVAAFFSVTSVFISVPILTLAALREAADRRPSAAARVVPALATFYALVFLAYLAVRSRTNPLLRADFGSGFMPLDSWDSAWRFIAVSGRRLLETSLPSWKETDLLNPETVSWPLPIVGLGLLWLLVRPPVRWLGLAVAGAYSAALVASALEMYPLGTGRPDIYAFPLAMILMVAGAHALTAWIPGREVVRLLAGAAAAWVALAAPLRPAYFGVDDVRLVREVAAHAGEDEGIIISPSGGYLMSFYGPWPIAVSPTTERSNGTRAEIVRPLTLHLASDETDPGPAIDAFLTAHPPRVWYVAFRTALEAETVAAVERHGYSLERVEETTRGALFRGSR